MSLNIAFMSIILTVSMTSVKRVKTPNGSYVEAFELDELSQNEIISKNKESDSEFPLAVRISSASNHYNCHSYAWYSQNVLDNHYWINSPSKYYDDGSYYEVSFNDVQPRDRICYYDVTGYNLHSGIVSKVLDVEPNNVCSSSNTVIVQSKWGNYGLYQHYGDYCPYVSTFDGSGKYVKYYRLNNNHLHSYTYKNMDEYYHYEICECATLLFKHRFVENRVHHRMISPLYISEYVCEDCGYFTLNPPIDL